MPVRRGASRGPEYAPAPPVLGRPPWRSAGFSLVDVLAGLMLLSILTTMSVPPPVATPMISGPSRRRATWRRGSTGPDGGGVAHGGRRHPLRAGRRPARGPAPDAALAVGRGSTGSAGRAPGLATRSGDRPLRSASARCPGTRTRATSVRVSRTFPAAFPGICGSLGRCYPLRSARVGARWSSGPAHRYSGVLRRWHRVWKPPVGSETAHHEGPIG
jgi:hypothetical protein